MIRKSEKFGTSIVKEGTLSEKCGYVEYTISAKMADHILKTHKGPKTNKQDILCKYVNQECGLKGKCVKVLVDLD